MSTLFRRRNSVVGSLPGMIAAGFMSLDTDSDRDPVGRATLEDDPLDA